MTTYAYRGSVEDFYSGDLSADEVALIAEQDLGSVVYDMVDDGIIDLDAYGLTPRAEIPVDVLNELIDVHFVQVDPSAFVD